MVNMLETVALGSDIHELILISLFLVSLIIQLIYWLGIFSRFIFYRQEEKGPSAALPVSVIICARNEAENLGRYLTSVLEQDYPDFEVIVVDDCSTDDTDDVLGRFMEKYPLLRRTEIRPDKKFTHGKKLAVTLGIKAARYEHLLFIDADCMPESNRWIRRMAAHFGDGTNIVLGYGGYFREPGWLNGYIRFDTLWIALQYFSFAICRNPYMGVGRNLGYTKSLFFSGNGFARHLHLASGDDDLFINEHATGRNTAVEFSHESHTRSDPEHKAEKWIYQKRRHLSTAGLYRMNHQFLLFLEPVSRLLFYAFFVASLFSPAFLYAALAGFCVRLIIQLIVIKKTMIRLNEKNLLINSLFFDLLSLFVNFGLYLSTRFRPVKQPWK